jgi:hypothetical protein
MGCRGVLFALTAEQETALNATRDDPGVRDFVQEVEDDWDDDWLCEVDKSWDAMHRCLSDGTLRLRRPESPLELAILGGGHHYEGEEYVVAHVKAADVPRVAGALLTVERYWLRKRYDAIDPDDYQGVKENEDFEYTWAYFKEAREFYQRAAAAGRAVIFTVDQ